MITSRELRQKFLSFFESKGHKVIPSASLIPENDPSVLFTTAGMHPLVPYLLGEKHPAGSRIASCQKCVRTQDIDEIGDNRHETFFEMLGNWSFGDPASPDGIGRAGYFKKEAIEWSWEFLTSPDWLDLNSKKIAVSVFAGDSDAPRDEESARIWKSLGIPEHKIAYLPKEKNWWGPAGQIGPCGPDTEMFYWIGEGLPSKDSHPGNDEENWLEIWNDVFMEYNKEADSSFQSLKQKNVDTGLGLERTLVALNGFVDVFQIDTFWPLIQKIEEISGREYIEGGEIIKSMRIIADHLRTAAMIMGDDRGIAPSNVDQGYIVRRLIRRAVRHGEMLGIKENFCSIIAEKVIEIFADVYPEVRRNKKFVLLGTIKEEDKFRNTIERAIKKVEFIAVPLKAPTEAGIITPGKIITGRTAFDLYQSDGFPLEMFFEELDKHNVEYDKEKIRADFNMEMKKHQELSRASAEQKFKGGLADQSEQTTKYHTATHLLLAVLREILGPEIYQKGSNITAERLRFDFNWPRKLTAEEIKKIEDLVNGKIREDILVEMKEMPRDKALKSVKISFDPDKYGETVKVYKINDFSIELCGGPHVSRTGILGHFKIVKEEASSAGVRRIRAVLE